MDLMCKIMSCVNNIKRFEIDILIYIYFKVTVNDTNIKNLGQLWYEIKWCDSL